jgi:hypothetical protein
MVVLSAFTLIRAKKKGTTVIEIGIKKRLLHMGTYDLHFSFSVSNYLG